MPEYIIMMRFHGEPLQTLPYQNEAEARYQFRQRWAQMTSDDRELLQTFRLVSVERGRIELLADKDDFI